MVVLSELTSVFWGVALEGGKKKYTQTTERPVHISMAALDPVNTNDAGPLSVMIEHSTGSYVLCTLQRGVLFQQPLNLEFAAGEELSFFINGNGTVHLSGYFMPEDDFDQYPNASDDEDDSEMESSEEEDDAVDKGKKRLKQIANKKAKKAKLALEDLEDDDDDDSDDDDFVIDEAEEASEDEDDDDDDDDEMLEEDSDSDVEETPKPVTKKSKETPSKVAVVNAGKNKAKTNSATPSADAGKNKAQNEKNKSVQQTPSESQPQKTGDVTASAEGKKKKKKNKKKKNKNQGESQQQASSAAAESTATTATSPAASKPAKRVAEGGVVVEDVKQGHGPEAKIGKMVRVYYTGRLANGKVFDCCTSGNGFKFKLGKKEVISGWDVGLSGMKVGGKRKLVIPPKMGYGSQSAGPIPANSTLHFDVELRAVG